MILSMKSLFFRLFVGTSLCFASSSAIAQTANTPCFTSEMQQAWFQKNPQSKQIFEQARQFINKSSTTERPASASAIYTIPIVFHILHTGGNENISDAQVLDQVAILTRDFNLLNADTVNVVPPLKPIIGNPQIEFKLATRDPNGNCTNGIIRHWDANTHVWDGDFDKYQYSWPSNQYLNIYVVKTITFNAAGYTYLPASGVPDAVDCIVMLSTYVGSIGTSNVGLSRVLTHECGHWLDLLHTWGWSTVGTTCGDDGVFDTPITKGFTSCTPQAQICTQGITENVQNYMDYSYCCLMFTAGQSTRMQNAMTNPFYGRDGLSTPQNLAATGITNPGSNCQTQMDVKAVPGTTVCAGRPLSVKAFTWNANPTSYQWSASAAAIINSPNSQTTTIVFSGPGTATISCIATSAGGNAQKSVVVTIVNGTTNFTSDHFENFDATAAALPANWSIENPTTPNEMWMMNPTNGIGGTKCMCVPGEILSPATEEMLVTPSFDFKNNPGATFGFKYAYARATSTHADLFKVQASKDCGSTWQDVWVPGIATLAQGSGGVMSQVFIPNSNQWKYYEVTQHPNFIPFLNEANVRFRLFFREDPAGLQIGNRFYLDDVQFQKPQGVSEVAFAMGLQLRPNPNSGSFKLQFTADAASIGKISLFDISGRSVYEKNIVTSMAENSFEITSSLPSGVYFLQLQTSEGVALKKLIVE